MSRGSSDWNEDSLNEKPKFKVGDKVRTKITKDKFEKGSKPRFSKDIFTIKEVKYDTVYYYILDDVDNKFFYTEELLKID